MSLLKSLNDEISGGFKELQGTNTPFDVFWKDSDNDCIRIYDNDSLLDALKEMGGTVFTLYAEFTANKTDKTVNERPKLPSKAQPSINKNNGELISSKLLKVLYTFISDRKKWDECF